jgi:hypothetical protein
MVRCRQRRGGRLAGHHARVERDWRKRHAQHHRDHNDWPIHCRQHIADRADPANIKALKSLPERFG